MGYRDFPCAIGNAYVDHLHDLEHAEPVEAISDRQFRIDLHCDQLRAAIAHSQYVATEEDGKRHVTLAAERLPNHCDYPTVETAWRLLLKVAASSTNDRLGIGDAAISLFDLTLEHAAEELVDIEDKGGRVIYGAKA